MPGLVLIAAALAAAPPLKVASLGFSSQGVGQDVARRLEQRFAAQLELGEGLEVLPRSGCSVEAAGCLAEQAGRGATAVAAGSIARVGGRWSAGVKLVDPSSARALFATSVEGADEGALEHLLGDAARRARQSLGLTLSPASVTAAPQAGIEPAPAEVSASGLEPATPWKQFSLIGAGLVSIGVSTFFFAQAAEAQWILDDIERDPSLPGSEDLVRKAQNQASRGKTALGLGWGLAGAGAALVAGGVIWWLLDRPEGPSASLLPMPGGIAAAVAGTFP
ncbi:MAG: hypothetical protein IT380_06550 [Myxococcales bacterium]|nr:hypothetical protein [Myxococcales bacterium]